jgi:hypothetical protein
LDRPQRLARKEENLTARIHRGRVTPQSGSGTRQKNDVVNERFSFEVKSTSGKTYSLSRDVLATATQHALEDRKTMALIVSFLPPRNRPGRAKRYVLVEEDDFIELTGIDLDGTSLT